MIDAIENSTKVAKDPSRALARVNKPDQYIIKCMESRTGGFLALKPC